MSDYKLTQEQEQRFNEKFHCINGDCDGRGNISYQVEEGEWESEPCWFCHEYIFPMKQHLAQEIQRAVEASDKEWRKDLDGDEVNDFWKNEIDSEINSSGALVGFYNENSPPIPPISDIISGVIVRYGLHKQTEIVDYLYQKGKITELESILFKEKIGEGL